MVRAAIQWSESDYDENGVNEHAWALEEAVMALMAGVTTGEGGDG